MKLLALERPVAGAAAERMRPLLRAEAQRTWELHQAGVLREAYFTEQHDAVLVLECATREQADSTLGSLPLVAAGLIRFEVLELRPYDGWARLFGPDQ
jgi:hypothetical protein